MACHSSSNWAKIRFAVAGEAVKPLVALVFLAPLAGQQPLGLQAPQQRVERAFVDLQAALGQGLAQRVAVVLLAKLRQHCQSQAAAPQFQAKVLEEVFGEGHAVPHTLYNNTLYRTQCMMSSAIVRNSPRLSPLRDKRGERCRIFTI